MNHLGDLSLPRNSVVRSTDCPNMTINCLPWTQNNNNMSDFYKRESFFYIIFASLVYKAMTKKEFTF